MDGEWHGQQIFNYQPEQWRNDESFQVRGAHSLNPHHGTRTTPDVWDRSRLLELLGLINYKLLTGNRVYVQAGGVVYRTLYGGYWRSVFSGREHYLLRCEEIPTSWPDGRAGTSIVDLPIVYSHDGWTTMGHSISFMVYQE